MAKEKMSNSKIHNKWPKRYQVQNDVVSVSEEMYQTLNILSGRFYECLNYIALPNHDYAASNHPTERAMFAMALEAYYMQLAGGELDG